MQHCRAVAEAPRKGRRPGLTTCRGKRASGFPDHCSQHVRRQRTQGSGLVGPHPHHNFKLAKCMAGTRAPAFPCDHSAVHAPTIGAGGPEDRDTRWKSSSGASSSPAPCRHGQRRPAGPRACGAADLGEGSCPPSGLFRAAHCAPAPAWACARGASTPWRAPQSGAAAPKAPRPAAKRRCAATAANGPFTPLPALAGAMRRLREVAPRPGRPGGEPGR